MDGGNTELNAVYFVMGRGEVGTGESSFTEKKKFGIWYKHILYLL